MDLLFGSLSTQSIISIARTVGILFLEVNAFCEPTEPETLKEPVCCESRRSPMGANPTRPIGRLAGSNQRVTVDGKYHLLLRFAGLRKRDRRDTGWVSHPPVRFLARRISAGIPYVSSESGCPSNHGENCQAARPIEAKISDLVHPCSFDASVDLPEARSLDRITHPASIIRDTSHGNGHW